MSDPSRRQILAGAALALAARLGLRTGRADEPGLYTRVSRPHDLETPAEALDGDATPNDRFFVRSHFGPAILDPRRFRLSVDGMVGRKLSLSLDDLARLPQVSLPAVLQCSGNGRALFSPRVPGAQWRRGAVGQAVWSGVRLRDVLQRAGIAKGARFVRLLGADLPPMATVPPFARSLPIEKALHPSTLIASRMNGAPLPLLHGAPLRMIVPGWVGDDWVKWLTSIRVDAEEDPGFYMRTGYRMPVPPVAPGETPKQTEPLTTMPVKSLITRPADRVVLPAAPTVVSGVAWAGERKVARVEVSIDGGRSFQPASLDTSRGLGAWQRWQLPWQPRPGRYRIVARATDEAGDTQPDRPIWNPGGYLWNGLDAIECEVRG
jgi:DMSO/TMAO reductase YedYZ molybdopterin-dependent catalytic subunit